ILVGKISAAAFCGHGMAVQIIVVVLTVLLTFIVGSSVIINRYLKDTSRLHSIHGEAEQQRMRELFDHFKDFAPEYQFDVLMMLAQGFQESRLDQSRRSHRGAVGVMQLLPSTAADDAVGIDDITTAENNILAGIRYMAWIRDTYFDDPALTDLNKTALAFASYNAGPSRVRSLRNKAGQRGLDPNVWFDNVEIIASEEIGRETVDYVANIYKYYLAFKLAQEKRDSGS
ncbi:MAG: transglycosylase SLT domain-containing protein, partial [Xanthomonadales bacterium]|nr:transglycosylase SLT domain-containing protein [Xanthomonadales bacterium]